MEQKPKTGQLLESTLSVVCRECGHVGELVVLLALGDAKEWREASKKKKKAAKKPKSE